MLKFFRKRNGQSLIEYTLILGAIIVGVLVMQLYVRRGLSGALRTAADDLGEQFDGDAQYSFTETRNSQITDSYNSATGLSTQIYNRDSTTRSGTETLRQDNDAWATW